MNHLALVRSTPISQLSVSLQVQNLTSPPRAGEIVKECIGACLKTTYQFLFDNCNELYQREFAGDQSTSPADNISVPGGDQHPASSETPVDDADSCPSSVTSLEFWHRLIALIVSIIEEDETKYTGCFNQLSRSLLWRQLIGPRSWSSVVGMTLSSAGLPIRQSRQLPVGPATFRGPGRL